LVHLLKNFRECWYVTAVSWSYMDRCKPVLCLQCNVAYEDCVTVSLIRNWWEGQCVPKGHYTNCCRECWYNWSSVKEDTEFRSWWKVSYFLCFCGRMYWIGTASVRWELILYLVLERTAPLPGHRVLCCDINPYPTNVIYIYIYIYIYRERERERERGRELLVKPEILMYIYTYMDLRLATLKAVSFYLLHNVSTLHQCRKFCCVTVVCKHFASYQGYPNYKWDLIR
jgi:hypothetical protein